MSLSETILNLFRGREDHVAVANDQGFRPVVLEEPMRPEWLEDRHLAQVQCLGFYLMRPDHTVMCSAVDFDNKTHAPDAEWKDKAEQLYFLLANAGLSPLVEVSSSGRAAHVWLFFSEPVPAWLIRAFWRGASQRLGFPFTEVYPRQERLSGKGLGNLLRYPLWSQSHFPDVESDWAVLDPEDALNHVKTTSGADLRMLAFQLGFPELKPETQNEVDSDGTGLPVRVRERIRLNTILRKRWEGDTSGLNDQSRSALVQSLACELVRQMCPTGEIEKALSVWCLEHGYEKGNRSDWISRTVQKAYDFSIPKEEKLSIETTTMEKSINTYIDIIEGGGIPKMPTGIREIDDSIEGLAFGEVVVIGARPSHGKSAMALQIIDTFASTGHPCLIISEEMSDIMLGKRGLQSVTDVPYDAWRVDGASARMRGQVEDYYSRRAPVYVVRGCNTVQRADDVISQHCSLYKTTVIAVDYLQLLSSDGSNHAEEVANVSKTLKKSTERNNCIMIEACQLNRELDKSNSNSKTQRLPRMSDIGASSQIEADADVILLLYWPHKAGDKGASVNDYIVVADKNRNGEIKTREIITTFNPQRQRFGEPIGMGN